LKSMLSNRTKGEYGRITISLTELEALVIFDTLSQIQSDKLWKFKKHLKKCIDLLSKLEPYNSCWVKDEESKQ